MTVAEHAPGRELLRGELERFVFKPGARGQLRLEAARGHDDLVIATALAVLAADIGPLELQNYSGLVALKGSQLGASVPSPQRAPIAIVVAVVGASEPAKPMIRGCARVLAAHLAAARNLEPCGATRSL